MISATGGWRQFSLQGGRVVRKRRRSPSDVTWRDHPEEEFMNAAITDMKLVAELLFAILIAWLCDIPSAAI